jgi:hypothetical protein
MIPRIVPAQIATVALGTTLLFGLGLISQIHGGTKPEIPKTWNDAAIEALEVPLANPVGLPKHISADFYYNIPVGQSTNSIRFMLQVASRLGIQTG